MAKLIGVLDESQKAMLALLAETEREVKAGRIKTMGIIACMETGPAWVMAGSNASNLFLGAAMMCDEIKDKVRGAGDATIDRAVQSIIRPKVVS